ncbi:MAG: alkaline phosphatase family protein [Rhodocyclaceae bacterium]|nr:alkaline phosphatase family protein [Rhodocyclaceae bacterium]
MIDLAISLAGRRLPAYGSNSILELVRWVGARLKRDGGEGAMAAPDGVPGEGGQRLVLALFDGLGDHYLGGPGASSAMRMARRSALTSVFPSTTASAVTTMMTGLSPATHGLNGWVCRGHDGVGLFEPLPMIYHETCKPLRHPVRRRRLFPYRSLYQGLGCTAFVISPAWLIDSDFSRHHSRGAAVAGYSALDEVPELLAFALERLGPRGLVYLYFPQFDATAHDFGMASAQLQQIFGELDDCFAALAACCEAGDATLLATADHGLIDAPEAEMICLGAEPAIASMLAMPLWGERRAAFCALRPGMEAAFREAIEARWPGRIDVLSGAQVIDAGLLGPGRPHRDLDVRVGDLLLLPRGGGTVVDAAAPQEVHRLVAVHGGLSAQEMSVPLLVSGAH